MAQNQKNSFPTILQQAVEGIGGSGATINSLKPAQRNELLNWVKGLKNQSGASGFPIDSWITETERQVNAANKATELGITPPPATPEEAEARKLSDAETVRKENAQKWTDLANLPLTSLKASFGLNDQEASAAHDRFVEAVNSYVDPSLEASLPDLVSQAGQATADPAAVAAQGRALAKTEALTGIQETPEERFMREQSRRTQERDLRSQREADKNSLLARGAYGSGAEIAMNGQAQQEAANRRQLEEMGANANAQQRALAAIGQMGNLSGQMRNQSFNEALSTGSAADAVRAGNRAYREGYNEWKRGQQVADERGKTERAGVIKQDADTTRAEADKRASALWGANTDVTAGATGQYSKDSAPVASAFGSGGSLKYNREIQKDIEDQNKGLLGGLF